MYNHRREEQVIERAVFQHFAARRTPGVFAFHVPNGGARSAIEASILKGLGVVAGIPDVVAVRERRMFALELKVEAGRLSPAQRATQDALRVAGAAVATSTGLDETLAQLEWWGFLRGACQ
jgi:hypothetical protein